MIINSLISKLLFFGTSSQIDEQVNRRILFSNVIYITLAIVYLVFMLIDYDSFIIPVELLKFDQFIVPVIILYCLFGLYLNKWGFSYLGRVVLIIIWPVLMQIIPIIILETPPDYYLAFPMGIVFYSVLIQLILSKNKESVSYYFFLAISLGLILTFTKILIHFDKNIDAATLNLVSDKYFYFVGILYWLLFNVMTFYTIKVLDNLITRNEKQKSELKQKNEELGNLNSQIDDNNRSLEQKVDQRTKELIAKNEILTSYAFYNAHLINGPFCRIKGLMMLKNLQAIEEKEYLEMLSLSMNELEKAIKKVQNHLNEVENADPITK